MYKRLILLIVLLIAVFACLYARAEGQPEPEQSVFDKNKYYEDTTPVDGMKLPVLVDKDTRKVDFFWSDDNDQWVEATKNKRDLQYFYDNRSKIRSQAQLRDMQREMDETHQDSWFSKKDQ